jgi:predicted Zn-ribbon and HTH transcriptional regulator
MTTDSLILLYVVTLLLAVGGLGIYSDLRRARFRPTRAEDRVFRCEKCGFVYTDDPDVDHSRCPQCSTLNEAIEF